MTMWTEQQTTALDALGIPRYQLNHAPAEAVANIQAEPTPAAAPIVEPVAAEAPAAVVATVAAPPVEQEPVLYQLGPWLLQFPLALPVNYYPWLNDLSQFIESRPTQVSAAGNKTIIDCAFVAKDILSPAEKRALWQQLKPFLNQ